MKRACALFLAVAGFLLTPGSVRAELGECPELGAALVDHTCFHTKYGPFESVHATPGPTVGDSTPNIDAVHTEFRIGLTSELSVTTYRPKRSGAWTVFLGSHETLRVLDDSGAELEQLFSATGDVGCGGLAQAHVFELRADEIYRLVFGPTTSSSVVVVIEHVGDFVIDNGRDADGDGYGVPNDVVRSACVPPSGYVQNTGDCDDDDPSLHPGVPELCDGVDQNCNGLPDDVGLECRSGEGECTAVGTVTCQGSVGAPAACSAEPGEAEAEICDGQDNDCDGVIDQKDDLCGEGTGGPTCVRQDFGAFCGCTLDEDCGASDGGRICEPSERRCVPVEVGGNGSDSGDGLAGGAGNEPSTSRAAGCGCRVGGAPSPLGPSAALGFLAGSIIARRRSLRTSHRRSRRASVAALLVTPWTCACGGQIDGVQDEGCVPVLGERSVAHACSHTDRGPYISVGTSVSQPPDVSRLHQTFSVLAIEEAGALTYTPTRHGEHVVLTSREVVLELFDGPTSSGAALESQPFPIESCGTLAWAHRFELASERTYTLLAREEVGSRFELFIEYPPAFGNDAWQRTCP